MMRIIAMNVVHHTSSFFSSFVDKHKAIKQRMRNTWSTVWLVNVWLGSQVRVHSCRQAAVVVTLLPGEM